MPQQDETQQDESPPVVEDPKLSPGMAFRLQPDGSWAVEKLPYPVLNKAKFSGYLTIRGYRCSVFETPDGSMWAQKSTNTPVTSSAKNLPPPDMSIKCPDCGGKAVDVRAYSACCTSGHFFSVKPKTASVEPKWVKPSIDDELPELERISSEEGFDLEHLKMAFASAIPKNLSEEDWSRLANSDSYGVESISQAESLAKGYGRDLASLIRGFQAGSSMKMPVVLELDDGTITLVGGNTRLMAARVLNISPKVLWVSTFDKGLNSMDTIASRAASIWLSNTAGSDDIVSQVTEILEEGGLGDGEDNDYDDDIVKWCEKIQDKIPEMQEIFDEAFHQVMDFKDKVPVSDNPRVRQIADDKIAGMLNESAARLEIISHGLVKEIQSLCSGLAAGASKVKKESSMKPSQLVIQLREIADKIDASKSPNRNLVASDISNLMKNLT